MNTHKNKWPCPGKPEALIGMPIGMYHCEFCGEMQLAGSSHLPPQFPSQWEEPFPRVPEPDGGRRVSMSAPNETLLCFSCGEPIAPGPFKSTVGGWGGLDYHEACAPANARINRLALDRRNKAGR